MLKNTLAATALLTTVLISVSTNAANVVFGDSVSLNGWELFPPAPELTWLEVDSVDLSALPQFDSSLGTLTGVTLSIVGGLDYGMDVYGYDTNDDSLENSMQGDAVVAVTAEVPASGGPIVAPYMTAGTSVFCMEEAYSGPCFDFTEESADVDISEEFTGSDMAAFIGSGDLSAVDVNLLLALNLFSSDNILEPESSIFVEFYGDVVVSYDYSITPVPLPAAFWMMGSALAGLAGIKRLRRS